MRISIRVLAPGGTYLGSWLSERSLTKRGPPGQRTPNAVGVRDIYSGSLVIRTWMCASAACVGLRRNNRSFKSGDHIYKCYRIGSICQGLFSDCTEPVADADVPAGPFEVMPRGTALRIERQARKRPRNA